MARSDAHGKLKLSLSPDEAPAQGVGATLRDARLRRGWSIDDCAQSLRIRAAVLTAMEAGRFERLPNGAYALGFVRSYADFLGLDRDEIARRVKAEAAALSAKTELVFPTPISEGRLPSGLILLASVVLAAGAYGIWYYHTSADRAPIPRVAAVPEQVTAPAAAPAAPASPAPAESTTAAAAPVAPAESAPAPQTAAPAPQTAAVPAQPAAPAASSTSEVQPAPATAAVSPALNTADATPARPAAMPGSAAAATTSSTETNAPGTPRQYGETTDGRIIIKATGDSWVQVRDPSGNVVFSRILRAGESYAAPNQGGYLLATGSAGMLDIVVDGKKAPSLGRPGFVRKDVPLDPEKLLAGTAVPPEVVRPAATPNSGEAPAAPAATPAASPPATLPSPATGG